MKYLYPEIEPYHTFFLKTGSQHEVYVEESGNAQGIPVIFLHGGPCSGTKPDHRRFFNPQQYRIILFDQRGCGLSKPFGEIESNTTKDLCADMERIRQQLKIKQWLLFGGSWGASLVLLYAQQNPERIAGMIIRGVFLARQQDLDWFLLDGVRRIYPEQWQRLEETVPAPHRNNLLRALYEAVLGEDEITKRRVAKEWAAWGGQVALGSDFQPCSQGNHVTEKMVKQALMELHYAKHHYFIEENQILENCALLSEIPAVVIHGRKDLVCPMESAMKLHQALPHADYIVLPEAGHVAQGLDMIDALVSATDQFASRWTG
ncbi:MAG: prolyl aminopeptidase [Methylococcaceae bacterium]|nr:prolyl aminopeptidase [Methylococcaceae bacterium]